MQCHRNYLPARILSMMMGAWLASSFTGGFSSGFLGSFWSRMPHLAFFLMIAGHRRRRRLDDPSLPSAAEGRVGGMTSAAKCYELCL